MDLTRPSNNEVNPTAAVDYVLTVIECKKAGRWRGTFRWQVTVS